MTTTSSGAHAVPVSTAPAARGSGAERPRRARDRVLGLSGLGFVAVLVPVIAIPHAALDYDYDKPPASPVITEFFRRHHTLEQYQALMHSTAAVLLLVFGCALAAQVGRVEGPARLASRLTHAGAVGVSTIMAVTMLLVAGSITMTGGVDGRTQGWLYSIGWNDHFKALYFVPLLLSPACVVLGRSGALPRWLTWGGQGVAVLSAVAMVGGLTEGTEVLQFPVFFLLMLWVLATGIVALTRGVAAGTD
jgi:hypothetical protein